MHQVFANLISNSLKFCERIPAINISLRIISGVEANAESELDHNRKYAELVSLIMESALITNTGKKHLKCFNGCILNQPIVELVSGSVL
jgi:hypothetical protein